MPPPLSRFPSGPNTISPYHQQFPSHAQGHGGSHPPSLGGNPPYLNANAGISPFATNGNVLSVAAGLNGGFGVGADTGLGSHAARMGFAHAANIQQQHGQSQQHNMLVEHPNMRTHTNKGRIREVWKHNLHEEMAVLRDLVDKYPYIAMVSFGWRFLQMYPCMSGLKF
jgi:CCR4-NOT transcription complex subunit 7/8